jgi:hypothetical protein
VADANEPLNYTFAVTASSGAATGAIVAFSGVSSTSPFDVTLPTAWNTVSNASLTTISSLTTATNNAAVVLFGNASRLTTSLNANYQNASWSTTNLTGFTELYDVGHNGTNNTPCVGAAWVIDPTAGATGNGALNCNVNTNSRNMAGIMLALRASSPSVSVSSSFASVCVGSTVNLTSTVVDNPQMSSIAFQGFETTGSTMTYATTGSGGTQTGNTGGGDGPSTSLMLFQVPMDLGLIMGQQS